MPIEFSKEQFENLLKLVYLGNWMANAHRTEDIIEKYDETQSYIFSHAKEFGFGEYVHDEKVANGKFYPTAKFEEGTDVDELHEEYDEYTFWDELVDRLGERDFFRCYSQDEIKKMSEREWFEKLCEFTDKWAEEVEGNGIERLGIGDK